MCHPIRSGPRKRRSVRRKPRGPHKPFAAVETVFSAAREAKRRPLRSTREVPRDAVPEAENQNQLSSGSDALVFGCTETSDKWRPEAEIFLRLVWFSSSGNIRNCGSLRCRRQVETVVRPPRSATCVVLSLRQPRISNRSRFHEGEL